MTHSEFEVFALRFAQRDVSVRGEHFYGHDPCALDDYPISYYVWLARSAQHTVLIDAGFTEQTAIRRKNRRYLGTPSELIRRLGSDPESIDHLVISHLHYDHTGCVADFPRATVILQEAEMAHWTGRHARREQIGHVAEPDDIAYLVRENFGGRVRQVNGECEVVPGLSVHLVGGHTPGLQVVRIRTSRGYVALAADASHFYENFESQRAYGIVTHLPAMYDAFDTLSELASEPGLIVPGHDPDVLKRFETVPGMEGIAVRIA